MNKKIIMLFLILFNSTFIFGLTPNFLDKENYYNQVVDIGVLDKDLECSFINIKISNEDQIYFNRVFTFNEINKIENIFKTTVSSNLVVTYETMDELTNVIDIFVFPLYLKNLDLGLVYLCDSIDCTINGDNDPFYFFNSSSEIFLITNNNFENINYSLELYNITNSENNLVFVENGATFPYRFYNLKDGDYKIVLNYVFETEIFSNNLFFNITDTSILDKESEEENIFYPNFAYGDEDYEYIDINTNYFTDDDEYFDEDEVVNKFFTLQNVIYLILIFVIITIILIIIFNKKSGKKGNRRQDRKILSLILFFFFICNFSLIFSNSLLLDTETTEQINLIFDHYRLEKNYKRSISVTFELFEDNKPKSSIIENYKIIPYDRDNVLRDPVIDSIYSNRFENEDVLYFFNTELKPVYFFNIKNEIQDTASSSCYDIVNAYYKTIVISKKFNLDNEQEVIRNYLLPRTKENIIEKINNNNLEQATKCFNLLLNEKILVPYNILLHTKIELKKPSKNPNGYQSIETISFEPKFINSIEDIDFIISFKKTPYVITSEYSMPVGCDKEDKDYCYITKSDITLLKQTEQYGAISSIEYIVKKANYSKYLNSFEIIKDLNEKKVSDISLSELLILAAMKREDYCFSKDKYEYNKIIFDVAKAYNLTDEQALQLWAIIAEKSNCDIDYFSDTSLIGLSQINLNDYYKKYYENLDPKTPAQLQEKEYIKYLALGNFSNINSELINKLGVNKITRYGGVPGEINTSYWYYEFLIKAIKTNKDKYGSLILYTGANYLKEMTTFVNFCNKYASENNLKNQYFNYDTFLSNSFKKNMTGIFILSSIIDKDTNQKELENICKIIGDAQTVTVENPILFSDKTGNYCIDNGYMVSRKYPTSRTITLPGSTKSKTYKGSGSLLYKLLDNGKVDTCVPGTNYTELVINPPKDLIEELRNNKSKKPAETNIKISKEFKVLINYLAIKNKYLTDKSYFEINKFITTDSDNQKKTAENISAYNKIPVSFFSDKKKEFLTSLKSKNINLLNRTNSNYYVYSGLLEINSKKTQQPGQPVGFVKTFGSAIFSEKQFPSFNTDSSWNFDVSEELKENYNIIWESQTVCLKKPGAGEKLPTENCVETPEVQSPYLNLNLLPDGAVLGLYVCKQDYLDINLNNLEYTHLGMYIGKNQYDNHLFIHMGNDVSINELSDFLKTKCDNGYSNEIIRVYVPKNTGVTNIKDLENISFRKELLQPTTWVDADLKELEKAKEGIKNNLDYPELESQILENDYGLEFLNQAKRHLGTKYIFCGRNGYSYAGGGLGQGIDCVGLLYVVLRDLGYIDGSTACKELFEDGCAILDFIDNEKGHLLGQGGTIRKKDDLEQLLPGDLLLLNTNLGGRFGHAAFYLGKENGNHMFIHASSGSAKAVIVDNLSAKLNSVGLNYPFHYARITRITDKIDCSKNYVSYYKRSKKCCDVTNYCWP